MMKPRILIVDDEWKMRHLLKLYLKKDNYEIDEASDGSIALSMLNKNKYNLIILDLMLPGVDGWEVCRLIRQTDETIPILLLTARGDVKDKVLGFNIGADDYLTKPFMPEELVVRIQALLRRQKLSEGKQDSHKLIQYNDLQINQESREVHILGRKLDLTPKEFDLLVLLAKYPKRVFTRDILLEQIWKTEDFRDIRNVDAHIKNLREKFREGGLKYNSIKTVWGVGYKFNQPDENS